LLTVLHKGRIYRLALYWGKQEPPERAREMTPQEFEVFKQKEPQKEVMLIAKGAEDVKAKLKDLIAVKPYPKKAGEI